MQPFPTRTSLNPLLRNELRAQLVTFLWLAVNTSTPSSVKGDVDRNTKFGIPGKTLHFMKRLILAALMGYTPNPGTALYVGYNDDLNRSGFNPFSGKLKPGFRRNGRTFFIKMSYLFRKSV